MLHQFCIMLVSCPSLRCSCRKKRVSCKEAKGLVTELWSPRFVTHNTVIVWFLVSKDNLCGILQKLAPCFHVTKATKQRTIVEIEILATVGWKRGCQPFSCRCSPNVLHCRKEMLFFSGIYFAIFSSKDIQRQGRCLSCETVMDSNDFSP